MSTTRSQKRRNTQQESIECVSEDLDSPVLVENACHLNQNASIAGPSRPKSPRIINSFSESLRASSKEEVTSEFKSLLVESQTEMLKLLKPKTGEKVRENIDEETENETRNFDTPTKCVQPKMTNRARVVTTTQRIRLATRTGKRQRLETITNQGSTGTKYREQRKK